MPVHLRPTAELAPRVLLPGDPGRALMLAQAVLDAPRMFNHHRGLWGYTGIASDGAPMTIQATGMGGPSAAIVVTELAELGARTLIRVGTCGSLDPALSLEDLVVVSEAICGDGTSRALGAEGRVAADEAIVAALAEAAPDALTAPVVTTDLFYGAAPEAPGAVAIEMEAATVLQVAILHGLRAGCVLVVSDEHLSGERVRLDQDRLERAGETVGRAGAQALIALDEDRAPPAAGP